MTVLSSITFWMVFSLLVGLSVLWGFAERWHKRYARGIYHQSLGYKGTSHAIQVVQGSTVILMIVVCGITFWQLGWPFGVASIVLCFVLGAILS